MRFIKVRSEAEVERRLMSGYDFAKAFHNPKQLSEDARQLRDQRRRGGRPESDSDGDDLLHFFKNMGVRVVDETRH